MKVSSSAGASQVPVGLFGLAMNPQARVVIDEGASRPDHGRGIALSAAGARAVFSVAPTASVASG